MRRRLDRHLARTDMAPAGWASIPAYQAWEGLTQLADLDTALNPRTLGPLDRVLLENRRRLRPAYLERG